MGVKKGKYTFFDMHRQICRAAPTVILQRIACFAPLNARVPPTAQIFLDHISVYIRPKSYT